MLKSTLPILLIIVFSFLSCKKESRDAEIEATITGIDLTLSACSGGYIVELADGTAKYQWEPTRSNMDDFGISDIPITDYPIRIKMDFKIALTKCTIFDAFIDISQLTIQ